MPRLSAPTPAHYVLLTFGTQGDMYPFISLALALRGLGRRITCLCPAAHVHLFERVGLPTLSFGTPDDYARLISRGNLWHYHRSFHALLREIGQDYLAIRQLLASLIAVEGPRVVVLSHAFTVPAAALLRDEGVPLRIVNVHLAPAGLRSCHDPLTIGPLCIPRGTPMAWRRRLWRLVDQQVVDPVAATQTNQARAVTGLAPIESFYSHIDRVADVTLALFPDWFAAPAPDWSTPLIQGVFPMFDPASPPDLAEDLAAFVQQGERPLVFTAGTGNTHAAVFFEAALAATTALGRRAVLLSQLREQLPATLPPAMHWAPYVPLSALLPHTAALVHHGGIGTTAEALRAGVPQLVVPFAWDQFDNAARVRHLKAGRALPGWRVNTPRLMRELRRLLASSVVRAGCARVADAAGRTRGIEAVVVELIKQLEPDEPIQSRDERPPG